MKETQATMRQEFAENGVKFGVDLYNAINQTDKWLNIAISPESVRLALGLAYLAVGPKTRLEMGTCLRFFDDRQANIDMLARTICKYNKNDHVHLACKVFVSKALTIKPGALETFDKLSKIAVHRVDFTNPERAAKTVNHWMESKTKNKIQNIVSPEAVENAALVIVSGFYFNMNWREPFVKKLSYMGEFWKNGTEKVEVPMMVKEHLHLYSFFLEFPELNCRSIQMSFDDGFHSMLIVLPDSKTGIDTLEEKFKQPNFNFLEFRKGRSDCVFANVTMPQFQYEYEANLVEPLMKTGMNTALGNPDFSNFFDQPGVHPIQGVFHKTIILVDESGVNAPHSEGREIHVGCAAVETFIIKHPFLFAILSKHDRLLFMGAVRDPSCTTLVYEMIQTHQSI